jgi:hypothetical protein
MQISLAMDGGMPNGASTHGVISQDKRFARAIAFQSDASNLVPNDVNGTTDVFAILRAGPVRNDGAAWRPGRTVLISRTFNGRPADGPSFSPAIDGSFHHPASCVAFLSAATNLVPGDTNGKVDAFVTRLRGGGPKRLSPSGAGQDTTSVAVSGDCKLFAFVTGGTLYVSRGAAAKPVAVPGPAADPSFSHGLRNDLVFSGARGVYLLRNGKGRPALVAPGGRKPAYNDLKRQVVAYEIAAAGHTQIAYRDLGKPARVISARGGSLGDGDSTDPVIGNAGFYVAFQSMASNLGTNANGNPGDSNGKPDVYLYTDVRKLTLVQSVEQKAAPVPGGGDNPSMSFYANYVLFDSPAPLGSSSGPHQVYMRYLGGI